MKATNLPTTEPRIVKKVDVKNLKVKGYDSDNAYPQRIIGLVDASPTTKQAIGIYTKFIVGGGFVDEKFYKTKINRRGLTPDDLLSRVGSDLARHRGYAAHINWNALYEVDTVYYTPFENVREGLEGTEYEGMFATYDNWDGTNGKMKKDDIVWTFPFNSDPSVIEQQVERAGGWDNYKGQTYYFSYDFEVYPLASCDAIIESMLSEIASDRTTTTNLRNNFSLKTIFVNIGEFEDEDERDEFKTNMKKFVGPDGEQVMIAEANDKEKVPQLIKVESMINDKLFQYTDEKVVRKIIRHYFQPAILHSVTDGGFFNKEQMQDAMDYYNGITRDERVKMEKFFEEVFSHYKEEINPTNNYQPKPLNYYEFTGTTPPAAPADNQE
ncbi:hypothetical protein B0I27_107114 [Arcticibacter pallidicorallinus]|uniref:Phage portal protein n=1 Tax=Arcticibacter pallidicorallinus TaxID=1259464 RepID=A0A2T0U108_9SPHI|nr:hypothetical protein [Arcticibacter pallidicorallinus]PRY51528.1 hypothetical protein B0I27_107114 [Arcticibacter pallidicorallinus]